MENNADKQFNIEYNKVTSSDQFDLSTIPVHNHDGIGSVKVDPRDLANASLYFAVNQTTLTYSQIRALYTTPINIVPAVGSGTTALYLNSVIIVDGITAKLYAGSTGFTGANNLEFRYSNGSGAKVAADISNTFINGTSNAYIYSPAVTSSFTPVPNSPIVACVPTADPAAGTGNIVVSVHYRVITL